MKNNLKQLCSDLKEFYKYSTRKDWYDYFKKGWYKIL